MNETQDPLIKGYDDDGPIRFMNEEEIRERQELNVANTASALRARVIAELAKANGHTETKVPART